MPSKDAAEECSALVQTYLRYAIENARTALTIKGEPATTEKAINYVCETLARMSTEV